MGDACLLLACPFLLVSTTSKLLLRRLCFMWYGSHFTVGVTLRLLLSSRISLLVINLLTIQERETRAEINLRTNFIFKPYSSITGGFFTKFIPITVYGIKCTVGHFFLFKIKFFVLKMVTN